MKKTNLLVLALSALLVASCGGDKKSPEATSNPAQSAGGASESQAQVVSPSATSQEEEVDYGQLSKDIYDEVFGEFYEYVQKAADAKSIAEKYALQGIAEAKLLEAGVMVPGQAGGGNYAISKIVPYSITPVNWGNDNYRYHNALITTETLKAVDRDALKALYGQLKGTGTYEAKAKEYVLGHGYQLKDSYTLAYTSDPTVFDILNSYYAVDAEPLLNTFDGLLEYDGEGVLQPALAESYEASEDNKTYTFTIRSGAQWVDKDGNKVADVTADDFVAGFQHMLDSAGGLEWLVDGLVVNAHEYLEGEITDFSQVGVKAEGNKVIYTLENPCDYFTTMLGYSIFAPMSRSYYLSQGGQFGADFDNKAESYHYAEDYSHIAYCGPYLLKQYTKENTFVFEANDAYWNKDHINIKTITWLFNDGQDSTKAYHDFKAGIIDGAGLNTSVMPEAKENGDFETYGYVSTPDANTYPFFININRAAYANANDANKLVSTKTDDQKKLSKAALLNKNVRLALCMSFDRETYFAISKGEDVALNAATNSWTPATFVSLPEEVTVKINGEDKTYRAGTYIGQVMQDQIDADGLGDYVTVFDPTADGGAGSGYGFDGWYNPVGVKEFLAKGVAELKAEGVVVDKEHPIVIDLPTYENDIAKAQANALAQSAEKASDGLFKFNVVVAETRTDQLWAVYYADNGYEMNYDLSTVSGWGPDYGDPKTYQDCFLPQGGGMVKCTGIF